MQVFLAPCLFFSQIWLIGSRNYSTDILEKENWTNPFNDPTIEDEDLPIGHLIVTRKLTFRGSMTMLTMKLQYVHWVESSGSTVFLYQFILFCT